MVQRSVTELKTAVVGTGLIGGSILLRLRQAGLDVTGWDPDRETREQARRRGLVFADELTDAVRDRDVVFLCGPLSTLPETLIRVAKATGDHCVITDVGSTKSSVAAAAEENGLTHRVVPGHPMSGTERSGLAAADPVLFSGAPWVLCPPAESPIGPFRTLCRMLVDVFEARVVPMSVAVHDTAVALASHIPHLMAGSLAGGVARSALRDAVLALAAGSFRDGTRVAGTPSARTVDMLINNREFVLSQVELVQGFLVDLVTALRDNDAQRLTAHYAQSRAVREDLLTRPLARSTERFSLSGPHDAELDFLLELGRLGGYLTQCAVEDSTVVYTVHRPEPLTPVG
ncbi:MAG TPA: prephenate dehydrogenase/arogenate dehydrogenase family protein [Micromonosporaceae bacterium]|nr:prephenate dehydrogenase/arogenate dehydrogenase family protein [Micromonosporaceae bacterium]